METTQLQAAIEQLPERYQYILILIRPRRPEADTLAELSDELEPSRERVRQLQREAERILRNGEYGLALSDVAA